MNMLMPLNYLKLGQVYIENRVVRENNAKEKELEFLRLRSKF